MLEIEDVIKWLTEISLRPCDFATDDFDSYETEHLANEALEICEEAKVFCKQRNDALELLKEKKAEIERLIKEKHSVIEQIENEINRLYKEKRNVKDEVGTATYEWLINGFQASLDMIKDGEK